MVETIYDDARYAVRNLRRDPFLALAATLTLAVCIGASTTVFSVANSILIRALPYPASERIDWIGERTGSGQPGAVAAPDYFELRKQNRIFEDVAAFSPATVNWTGIERPEQLDTANVTPPFFGVMGTQPLLGRYLAAEEQGRQAPPVAVLSYEFWRNRMGGDPQILGKTIAIDRLPRTIIGVMPQGFDFPRGSQLWLPAKNLDEATESFPISPNKPIWIVLTIGRRKPGVTPLEAVTEMKRLTLMIGALYPEEFRKNGFRQELTFVASPLQEHLAAQLRPAIMILTGAVALVLLIACANIANLLLARAGSRYRELAVRLALGSGRGRIIRQMLTESLVLSIPGGAAGIALAWLAVEVLNDTKPAILVRYPAISMDWHVLAFTFAVMVATSLLFGSFPALSAAGIHIQHALKSASITHSSGRGAARVRKILVVTEIGVSLILAIGAGLLARSFLHLVHTELGFRSDHLLSFRVNPVGFSFDRNYGPFYSDVLDRLQQLPMVRSAALADDIPLAQRELSATGFVRVIGRPMIALQDRPRISNNHVSPQFFETLGISLKAGRIFDAHDFIGAPAGPRPDLPLREVVVVNEAFVHRMFPNEDPLGRQLAFGPDELNLRWTIVGVVGDIRSEALGAEPSSMIYHCACGGPLYRAGLVVRTSVDPASIVRVVEQEVRAVDRDQPISDVKTMDQRRDAALAPERFQLMLLGELCSYRDSSGRGRGLWHHVVSSDAPHSRDRHSHGDGSAARRRPAHGNG